MPQSPLAAFVCAVLVGTACAGLVPVPVRQQSEVQGRGQPEAATSQLNQLEQQQQDVVKSEENRDDSATDATPVTTTVEPITDLPFSQQAPLAPAVSRVSSTSSHGAVSYAYHGQTQHAVESSQIRQTVTSNARAFPINPTQEVQFSDVPTFYHPEQIPLTVARADQVPASAYIEPQRAQLFTTHGAYLTPSAVPAFQAVQPSFAHYPVHPQPIREQTFTVNVASPKYGYGYSVRGIQHAEH
ncbi:hypothetical protein B566_EDAN014390 [Ephemera danica]|nr:hypothetical protein B566_EDAN014390 [Ephemera danica]